MDIKTMKNVIFCILLLPQCTYAIDAYICTTEKSAGFYLDKDANKWQSAKFKPKEKYLVVRLTDSLDSEWGITHPGWKNYYFVTCKNDFNQFDFLRCMGDKSFLMHKKSLRFIYTYPIGYVVPNDYIGSKDDGNNTPYMDIGTCKPYSKKELTNEK